MRLASLALFAFLVGCGGNVVVDRASATGTTTHTTNGAGGGATTTHTTPGAGGGATSTSSTTETFTTTSSTTTTGTITGTTTSTSGGGLLCGASTCNPGDECCWSNQAGDGKCLGAGSQCGGPGSNDTQIECQRPSDCPSGQICCGRRAMNGGPDNQHYRRVTCRDTCDAPDVTICDPASPQPIDCPPLPDGSVAQCKSSQLLPKGYFVCSQQ
jgi:hypothetical protein